MRSRLQVMTPPSDAAQRLSECWRVLEETLPTLPPAERREALGSLARLEALVQFDLTQSARADGPAPDRLLLATDVAARLSSTPEYVYRHAHQFPFTVRLGRAIRFSSAGLDDFIRTRQGR